MLAPRHPERFAAVASLLRVRQFRWCGDRTWKEWRRSLLQPLRRGQVVLLDTIGELASIYSLAAVAFVGGSLFPAGGHNPLEPAQFGVPIVMGPHYANFRAITDDLRAHEAHPHRHAGRAARRALRSALMTGPQASGNGRSARGSVSRQQAGATARCVDAILDWYATRVLAGAARPPA